MVLKDHFTNWVVGGHCLMDRKNKSNRQMCFVGYGYAGDHFSRSFIAINQKMFLAGWLCFTYHRQQSHLETAPPFTVPCEGRDPRFLHHSHRESNPGLSRGSPLHYRCATPAPL